MEMREEIVKAIDDGDINAFRRAFVPSDIDSHHPLGTPLHFAASFGELEIVKFLVEQGADVNIPEEFTPVPPITYAASDGHLDVVRFLYEAGASKFEHCLLSDPLICAAEDGHVEIVKYLLEAGIDPHRTYRHPNGQLINAMFRAEMYRHKDVVEVLKAYGCHKPVEGVDIPVDDEPGTSQPATESPEQRHYQSIIDYMAMRFGPVEPLGQQELLPLVEGMSVTINTILPNDFHPYLVLFTNGMSRLPMTTPAGKDEWRYAELVMHLPPDWVPPFQAGSDPQWLWPVKWLRTVAYQPHLNDSWLGLPAAIVSSADPPEPLGPHTRQSCLLLVPDFTLLSTPLQCVDGRVVHFFTAVPLYTEERDYELQHGMVKFIEKFIEKKVSMSFVANRKSFLED